MVLCVRLGMVEKSTRMGHQAVVHTARSLGISLIIEPKEVKSHSTPVRPADPPNPG